LKKLPIAILGTGNIGTDLLIKILRSKNLECRLFSGRNLSSAGMVKANSLNVPISNNGIDAILNLKSDIALVFDATSADAHLSNAALFLQKGLIAIDLTPAKIGEMCVPAVNLNECLSLKNVNMITCGGQASIPLACAITESNPNSVQYIETVSSISSRSAGPATRLNLDEYIKTTEYGIKKFTGCNKTKAILVLNPAVPHVHMQTTVMATVNNPDIQKTRAKVNEMVTIIKKYIPGYELILEPTIENGRLITSVRVKGLGDYLPKFAGNLDIINCAAIAFAESIANRY